jgi:hypothetical protein
MCISAIGADYIDIDGLRLYIDYNTAAIFDDVSGYAVGLPVQYKGVRDDNNVIRPRILK